MLKRNRGRSKKEKDDVRLKSGGHETQINRLGRKSHKQKRRSQDKNKEKM